MLLSLFSLQRSRLSDNGSHSREIGIGLFCGPRGGGLRERQIKSEKGKCSKDAFAMQ